MLAAIATPLVIAGVISLLRLGLAGPIDADGHSRPAPTFVALIVATAPPTFLLALTYRSLTHHRPASVWVFMIGGGLLSFATFLIWPIVAVVIGGPSALLVSAWSHSFLLIPLAVLGGAVAGCVFWLIRRPDRDLRPTQSTTTP